MALFDLGRKNLQILDFNFYLQIILFVDVFLTHREKKNQNQPPFLV